MSDIEERLLAMYSHRGDGLPTQLVNPDGPDAVKVIASLRAALTRIADDDCMDPWGEARAALASMGGQDGR